MFGRNNNSYIFKMSHGTGMGNYIRAGTKNPASTPLNGGEYTMIDDYNLENGYDAGYNDNNGNNDHDYNHNTKRKKHKSYSDSDSEEDSGDSDSESDYEDSDYHNRQTFTEKFNDYNGLISTLCLLLLIVIMWYIYHIRKDIDSMFGEN